MPVTSADGSNGQSAGGSEGQTKGGKAGCGGAAAAAPIVERAKIRRGVFIVDFRR